MEMPEKSIEQTTQDAPGLTLNENGPVAESEVKEVNHPQAAGDEAEATELHDAPAATAEAPVEAEVAEQRARRFNTAAEVVIALTELSQRDADEIAREEVSRLKQLFHTLRKSEDEAAMQAWLAEGGDPFAYTPSEETAQADAIFQGLMEQIKEKKAVRAAEVEALMQKNFDAKEALINEIGQLSADADNVNRHFPRFRDIQAEFKAIGEVDPRNSSDQWKRYQDAVELFYDQLKVNQELRDYDFKKNLDTKLLLCIEAESLANEADVVAAFKRLQDLHLQWRETGPVAKETREEIWARFKEASAVVNKAYQAFFEARKQREAENEAAKTALCEKVEAVDTAALTSFNAWNEATKTVLALQEEWKTLGFASKKVNNALFSRFREACDRFFEKKGEYYKSVKEDLSANLAKKTALCEEAESLMDSTKWKATADRLAELQKQWRGIGAVPKKQSDAIWTRFQTACDHFFERKKADYNSSRHTEQANLKAKRALTAELKALPEDMPREQVIAAIKDAQARWQQVGHVPFKEKDAVYAEFRTVIDNLFATRDLRAKGDSMARFESTISDSDPKGLSRERERLARVLEQKKADLQSYRNNLGFLSVKSSQGSSLLRDIERKAKRLEEDIVELTDKIAIIDSKK